MEWHLACNFKEFKVKALRISFAFQALALSPAASVVKTKNGQNDAREDGALVPNIPQTQKHWILLYPSFIPASFLLHAYLFNAGFLLYN